MYIGAWFVLILSVIMCITYAITYAICWLIFNIAATLTRHQHAPPFTNKVVVTGVLFDKNNSKSYGNLTWMVQNLGSYSIPQSSLFIFNDNVSDFQSKSCIAGGGNASIRPWQCYTPSHVTGVVTGPGWDSLTQSRKAIIDQGIQEARNLIRINNYTQVYYNKTSSTDDTIGHSIFAPGKDVLDYITQQILNLTT